MGKSKDKIIIFSFFFLGSHFFLFLSPPFINWFNLLLELIPCTNSAIQIIIFTISYSHTKLPCLKDQIHFLRLPLGVKFSVDDILKYFSYFSQKTEFDILCKLSPMQTICKKCQILFSGKNKKNITNLLSAAQSCSRKC